jgi:Polysaccharide pyruvyl transferase
MKKIAVLCAYPAGLNPGMLSVDFALDDILTKFADQIVFDRYCIEAPIKISGPNGVISYFHLQNIDQLSDYDSIIFWGDFLHWIGYGNQDFLNRQKKRHPAIESSKILDSWFELCLLEKSKSLQERSIIFGSTIYGLNSNQLVDKRYLQNLSFLYSHAKLVLLRDSLSASFAKQITGKNDNFFGCDCAFFLDTSSWKSTDTIGQPYILCSFGRSEASLMLQAFTNLLGSFARIKVVNIDWLDNTGFDGLKTKIALVKHANLIITDIYHLSVTALREDKQVICIGRGAQTICSSLSDKKKEILFYQSMLANNYLFFEEIHKSMQNNSEALKLVKRVIDVAFDSTSRLVAHSFLTRQISSARDRLLNTLRLI